MKLHLKSKCLGGLALSLLITGAYAGIPLTPVQSFTPFDLEHAPGGYIITGTITVPSPNGVVSIPGAKIIVDPPNHRVAYWFGPVGNFITTDAGSFNYSGNPANNPACLTYPQFKYNTYKTNYAQLTALPGGTNYDATYSGYTHDSFSCGSAITFTFRQQLSIANRIGTNVTTGLYVALQKPTGSTCSEVQAYFTGDINTVDLTSDRNPYFVLPDNCTTHPIDFCSVAYAPQVPPTQTDPGVPNACYIPYTVPTP